MSSNTKTTLMTEGSIPKKMVAFAFPIFLGNLFQQLYNTADSLIVGNFLGSSALAAVSSAGNLIFLFIGFFIGLSVGAGVVISNYIGARDKERTELAVHTNIALGLASSVILTILGVAFAPAILKLINTPDDVMADSVAYFRIYFAGATGFVMYNTFVGILRAAGDSKHPLYFLIVSSIINIVLDLLFIVVFHLGVGSVALATVISQLVSALLCMFLLLRTKESYHMEFRKIGFNAPILGRIINYGLPAGIQNSVIGFANVLVQSYINVYGQMAMAGHGAYSKIEGFGFLPITSFTMALTTFIGQNMGARDYRRVKKGAAFGTICTVGLAELIGLIIFIFAPVLISAFDSTPEAVAYGIQRTRTDTLFYCLLAFSHAMASVLRGEGKSTVPMVIMLSFWCVIRVTILALSNVYFHSILVVNWVYPLTWGLSSIAYVIYYIAANPIKKLEASTRSHS